MSKSWVGLGLVAMVVLAVAGPAAAEVVTLKDGRVIVAKSVRTSGGKVYVRTDKGQEVFDEDQVASIVEGGTAPAAPTRAPGQPVAPPSSQPAAAGDSKVVAPTPAGPAARETLLANLETLYQLGKYDEVVALGSGKLPAGTPLKARVVLARAYCRLGKFAEAEKLYRELATTLPMAERGPAKVAADVIKANPDGTWKGAAGLSAAELMASASSQPAGGAAGPAPASSSLRDERIFQAAMRAVAAEQVRAALPMIEALKTGLKPEQTAADFERARGAKPRLTYDATKQKIELILDQSDAVSPGVAASLRKELVRAEAEHLEGVLSTLRDKAEELGPGGTKTYRADVETGKMTLNAQKEWQQQTDQAIAAQKIALAVAEHLLGLYKLNAADFPDKVPQAEAKVADIKGQIAGLLKDRGRVFLK